MPLLKLAYPPGVHRNGTEYQNAARFWNANLVRFYEGTLRPVNGWRVLSQDPLDGKGRAILTWRTNGGSGWAAVGTDEKLYAVSLSGTVTDITPAGFTPGRPDADFAGGYGAGPYGTGIYGIPREDATVMNPASMWSLDNWGENLVGVMAEDGLIYEWGLNIATPAAPVANAPTARAILVTNERILMALGAGGNPRNVAWSDQENNGEWTPDATNQAGDQDLQTNGKLVCGKRVRGGNLLFTDVDVHFAQYLGPPYIYGFDRIGAGCGAVSPGCVVVADAGAFWMGENAFWAYNGYVAPLPCDVGDFVFRTIERSQISKTVALHHSAFGEIWWLYQDNVASEINRYVIYNYRERHWTIGALSRLSGVDREVFGFPLMVGADGEVYEHEIGWSYDGAAPFAEGGPIEIGSGDRVAMVNRYVPDELTSGGVNTTFYVRPWPNAARTAIGPFPAANPVDLRFTGRQVSVRYTGASMTDWRVGVPRIDIMAGGRR